MDRPLSFEEFQKCIQSGVFPGAMQPMAPVPSSNNAPNVPDGIEIVVEDDEDDSCRPRDSYDETFARRPRPISLNNPSPQVTVPQPPNTLFQQDLQGELQSSNMRNLPPPPNLPFPIPVPGTNFNQNQINDANQSKSGRQNFSAPSAPKAMKFPETEGKFPMFPLPPIPDFKSMPGAPNQNLNFQANINFNKTAPEVNPQNFSSVASELADVKDQLMRIDPFGNTNSNRQSDFSRNENSARRMGSSSNERTFTGSSSHSRSVDCAPKSLDFSTDGPRYGAEKRVETNTSRTNNSRPGYMSRAPEEKLERSGQRSMGTSNDNWRTGSDDRGRYDQKHSSPNLQNRNFDSERQVDNLNRNENWQDSKSLHERRDHSSSRNSDLRPSRENSGSNKDNFSNRDPKRNFGHSRDTLSNNQENKPREFREEPYRPVSKGRYDDRRSSDNPNHPRSEKVDRNLSNNNFNDRTEPKEMRGGQFRARDESTSKWADRDSIDVNRNQSSLDRRDDVPRPNYPTEKEQFRVRSANEPQRDAGFHNRHPRETENRDKQNPRHMDYPKKNYERENFERNNFTKDGDSDGHRFNRNPNFPVPSSEKFERDSVNREGMGQQGSSRENFQSSRQAWRRYDVKEDPKSSSQRGNFAPEPKFQSSNQQFLPPSSSNSQSTSFANFKPSGDPSSQLKRNSNETCSSSSPTSSMPPPPPLPPFAQQATSNMQNLFSLQNRAPPAPTMTMSSSSVVSKNEESGRDSDEKRVSKADIGGQQFGASEKIEELTNETPSPGVDFEVVEESATSTPGTTTTSLVKHERGDSFGNREHSRNKEETPVNLEPVSKNFHDASSSSGLLKRPPPFAPVANETAKRTAMTCELGYPEECIEKTEERREQWDEEERCLPYRTKEEVRLYWERTQGIKHADGLSDEIENTKSVDAEEWSEDTGAGFSISFQNSDDEKSIIEAEESSLPPGIKRINSPPVKDLHIRSQASSYQRNMEKNAPTNMGKAVKRTAGDIVRSSEDQVRNNKELKTENPRQNMNAQRNESGMEQRGRMPAPVAQSGDTRVLQNQVRPTPRNLAPRYSVGNMRTTGPNSSGGSNFPNRMPAVRPSNPDVSPRMPLRGTSNNQQAAPGLRAPLQRAPGFGEPFRGQRMPAVRPPVNVPGPQHQRLPVTSSSNSTRPLMGSERNSASHSMHKTAMPSDANVRGPSFQQRAVRPATHPAPGIVQPNKTVDAPVCNVQSKPVPPHVKLANDTKQSASQREPLGHSKDGITTQKCFGEDRSKSANQLTQQDQSNATKQAVVHQTPLSQRVGNVNDSNENAASTAKDGITTQKGFGEDRSKIGGQLPQQDQSNATKEAVVHPTSLSQRLGNVNEANKNAASTTKVAGPRAPAVRPLSRTPIAQRLGTTNQVTTPHAVTLRRESPDISVSKAEDKIKPQSEPISASGGQSKLKEDAVEVKSELIERNAKVKTVEDVSGKQNENVHSNVVGTTSGTAGGGRELPKSDFSKTSPQKITFSTRTPNVGPQISPQKQNNFGASTTAWSNPRMAPVGVNKPRYVAPGIVDLRASNPQTITAPRTTSSVNEVRKVSQAPLPSQAKVSVNGEQPKIVKNEAAAVMKSEVVPKVADRNTKLSSDEKISEPKKKSAVSSPKQETPSSSPSAAPSNTVIKLKRTEIRRNSSPANNIQASKPDMEASSEKANSDGNDKAVSTAPVVAEAAESKQTPKIVPLKPVIPSLKPIRPVAKSPGAPPFSAIATAPLSGTGQNTNQPSTTVSANQKLEPVSQKSDPGVSKLSVKTEVTPADQKKTNATGPSELVNKSAISKTTGTEQNSQGSVNVGTGGGANFVQKMDQKPMKLPAIDSGTLQLRINNDVAAVKKASAKAKFKCNDCGIGHTDKESFLKHLQNPEHFERLKSRLQLSECFDGNKCRLCEQQVTSETTDKVQHLKLHL